MSLEELTVKECFSSTATPEKFRKDVNGDQWLVVHKDNGSNNPDMDSIVYCLERPNKGDRVRQYSIGGKKNPIKGLGSIVLKDLDSNAAAYLYCREDETYIRNMVPGIIVSGRQVVDGTQMKLGNNDRIQIGDYKLDFYDNIETLKAQVELVAGSTQLS